MPDSLLSNLAADNAHRCDRRQWLADNALPHAAGPAKTDWLTDAGWMTQRLRQLCGTSFHFHVMRIGSMPLGDGERRLLNTADKNAVCREIQFRLESEPLLFAQVVMTRQTAARQRWLESRDARPLGDELAGRHDVERSDFRFSLIGSEDPVYSRALAQSSKIDETLWLRQSVFSIGGDLLLVNEVFLPALWCVAARG